jgi:formylglycine-generating enzyme required for sulfatase activity
VEDVEDLTVEDSETISEDTEFEEIDEDVEIVDDVEDVENLPDDDSEAVPDDSEFEEIDEDVEIVDDVENVEDMDDAGGGSGSGLPDDAPNYIVGKDEKLRQLSEQFIRQLDAMDRYYNSYLKIPAGNYLIGSPNPGKHELQEHTIQLRDFYIGKFPVTNSLFEVFIAKTGYKTTAEKLGFGTVYSGRFKKHVDKKTGQIRTVWNSTHSYHVVKGACWYHPDGPESSIVHRLNHPVVQVSLEDALAFAAWVGKRIPTEVEWEAAARTQNGYIYPWGNAWVQKGCNMEKEAVSGTTPVDRYLDYANGLQIVDLLGNVLEWTVDTIISPYQSRKDIVYMIAKGGSWISNQEFPLWSRFILKENDTSNILGFRCSVS